MKTMTFIPVSSDSRPWLRRMVFVVALQALAAAAFFLRPGSDAVLIGAGCALLAAALIAVTLRSPALIDSAAEPSRSRLHPRLLIAGLLALLIVVLWSAAQSGTPLAPPPIAVQFMVWLAGVALIAAGLGAFSGLSLAIPRAEAAALLAIAVYALIVRGWGLDTLVRGLIDEAIYINGILRLWDRPDTGLLTSLSMIAPTTAVYTAANAAGVELFGANLVGLRALNVLLGVLGVLALYALARALYGGRIALVAALILASFPPHIHFTRIAMPQPADALFGTLALACAANALRTRRASDWARAGVFLGLTSYFYEGGRLLFPALMLVWLIALRRFDGLRRVLTAFALIAAPVYLTMLLTGTPFARRMEDVGLGVGWWKQVFAFGVTPDALLTALYRLAQPLLVYVHQPDITTEFYGGDQAMVLTLFVPLLIAGVGAAPRQRAGMLPILWALGGALGNALLIVTAAHQRYVAVHPAVALLMALGVCALIDLVLSGRAARIAVIAAALGIAAVHTGYYFGAHLPLFNVQFRAAKFYPDGVDGVLRAAESLPPDMPLIFISTPPDDDLLLRRLRRFLHPERRAVQVIALDAAALTPEAIAALPAGDLALFIAPDSLHTIAIFGQLFNLQPPQISPYDIPEGEMYTLFVARRVE